MTPGFPLNAENYKHGFLVDDEVIGGVTEMSGGIFSAYVSHYLTGETYLYQEFDGLDPALEFLSTVDRPWAFEGVGCEHNAHAKAAKTSGCGSGGCASGGCNA